MKILNHENWSYAVVPIVTAIRFRLFGAYFWFRALCDTEHTINVSIVQYNIPPCKSFFRPSLETVSN